MQIKDGGFKDIRCVWQAVCRLRYTKNGGRVLVFGMPGGSQHDVGPALCYVARSSSEILRIPSSFPGPRDLCFYSSEKYN